MPAYVIGRLTIEHRGWMDEYYAKVPALVEQHGGRFLVRGGNPQPVEGDETMPDGVVVIEFPTRADAVAFWESPEFAPLMRLRQTGARLQALVVDGLA